MATATTWFYTYCLPLPLHDALPNLTEPGLWLQYDFGDGPTISGRKTTLFCAWLAWSRFRVVIPIWDKTLPTVAACLDATRSEEHTSELQSLMRISYAVICLKKKNHNKS